MKNIDIYYYIRSNHYVQQENADISIYFTSPSTLSSTAWGYKNFILGKRILEIKLMDTFVGNSYENCLSSLSLFFLVYAGHG